MPDLCSACPNLSHYRQQQDQRQGADCVVAPPRYHSSPRNRKVPGAFSCSRFSPLWGPWGESSPGSTRSGHRLGRTNAFAQLPGQSPRFDASEITQSAVQG